MVVELGMRNFKDGYLLNIQNTLVIALDWKYIHNVGINRLGAIAHPTDMIDKTFNSDKEIK
ncbi:MAG: hypothetical protein U9N06_02130 [candidate division WOR-3 bacterium]|nr:hypothetical protein [candidate division WOR-3 bacterium]